MSSVIFNQVHQQSSSKKVPTKKMLYANILIIIVVNLQRFKCKHFNHNRCKFTTIYNDICRNFISGSCGSIKCSFDHVKLCPVLACNNKYCSIAHAPKVDDVNSDVNKNCKSHSSPFRRPFLVHHTQAKISHQNSSGTAQKLKKPFPIPNSPPLSFATSSPSPHTEVLFPPPHSMLPYTLLLCHKPAIS